MMNAFVLIVVSIFMRMMMSIIIIVTAILKTTIVIIVTVITITMTIIIIATIIKMKFLLQSTHVIYLLHNYTFFDLQNYCNFRIYKSSHTD